MNEPQSMAGIPRADRYAQQADDRALEHFRKVLSDIMTKSRLGTHSDQINEIATALAKAQAEFETPKKTKTADAGKYTYTYADLQDVYDSVRKPLAANGLAVTHLCQEFAGQVELVTMLTHSSGQWFKSIYPVRAKTDSPQNFGSAMTYAKRYSASALLGIASEEDDDGVAAETSAPIEKPTPATKPQLVHEQPAQDPEKPAGKLSVMLASGGIQAFPRTQGGAKAALLCIEQAVGERPDCWGPNAEVAWTIAKELPQLQIREGMTAPMLVEQLEGESVGPML